ncbi:hypothetical protein RN001_000970 [Aquatica leii]|uniref:Vitellogenin receptor n=1 Tax=Aquatica leii TaxID=1421715 RepID=A0AAN7SKX4_9COLE|nr:hypothetical protein RN001_000970 [Aquatica leii]
MFSTKYIEIGVIQIIACFVIKLAYGLENRCISNLDFPCVTTNQCIPKTKRCDGQRDCLDESDEWDCDTYRCEEPLWFRCKNKECISHAYICDSENDCGDNSDEEKCSSSLIVPQNCSKGQWQCSDHLCILSEWVCNGKEDCLDGSDETVGCEHNKCDGFKCKNGQCIYNQWHCDGIKDCKDGTDELNCSTPVKPSECKLEQNMIFCNGSCIALKHFCEEDAYCTDVHDRSIMCRNNNKTCKNLSCSYQCVMTDLGAKCVCAEGYQLSNDMVTCTDINECNIYGICDQKCKNTPGSYNCYCDQHYQLQADKKTCKAKVGEALLVFSSKTEIRGYYLNSGIYFPIAQNLTQSIGVAFDGRYMYWTEIMVGHERIVKALEDGSHKQVLVTSGLDMPEDLAVDFITGNIYFTDAEMKHIGVCTNDGMYCTILVNKDVQNPRSIVLYPQKGLMYWTDWGKRPEIARAKMDGTNDISFVANAIYWPNGLALDIPNERLYWVDAKIMTLQSIKLDGTGRRIILENIIKHPYALDVFENQVFWSDWLTNTIESCDKFTGKNHNVLIKQKNNIYGVHVYHPATQTYDRNPCAMSFCSHICLLSGTGYVCACPENKILGTDKHSCRAAERDQVLIASSPNRLILFQHQELGKHNETVLPVLVNNVSAMTYSSNTGILFISEASSRSIVAIDIQNGLREPVTREKSVDLVISMDFDNVGNNIYWCDSVRSTVEVLSLNSISRAILLSDMDKETPISIAVVPNEGVMFVAFQKPNQLAHIDRMNMDGSHRIHIVEKQLMGPIHLLHDATLNRMFWADTGNGIIESTSIEGDDRHGFQSLHQSPIAITSLNKNLFWINHNSKKLFWANKINGGEGVKGIELELISNMTLNNIISIMPRKVEPHPCLKDNGNCSHVCIPNYKEAVCACPFGLKLTTDKQTCIRGSYCELNEFYCNQSNVCIKQEQRCNHYKNCLFGEDEKNCSYHHLKCDSNQFQCKNKVCIKKELVCNSKYDCVDKSDEDNCNKDKTSKCPSNNFKCLNGDCIESKLLCNGKKDCTDGSDEKCTNFTCASHQFRCKDGSCIPYKWECDHEFDCNDKSDEHQNCKYRCEPPNFRCSNGLCIDSKLKCNIVDDCGDSSDEVNCNHSPPTKNCRPNEFRCLDNTCINMRFRCSGHAECSSGEDELNCTNCQTNEFQCNNKKCIRTDWLCDHTDDCGDGSDESIQVCAHEPDINLHESMSSCNQKFRCKNGKCIEKVLLCNDVDDCDDGSDEFGLCTSACSRNNNPCAQICVKTPSGPQCECDKGFVLRGDGKTCIDVKECLSEPPVCSQICVETHGSYACSCRDGFILRTDMKSCKSSGDAMSFIFTSSNEIYQLLPRNYTLRLLYTDNVSTISGLDIQIEQNQLYFSIEKTQSLHRINLNNNYHDYITDIGYPQKLSVDWITQNVYFVNNNFPRSSIRMCNFESKFCAHVVDAGINNNVTSIAVESLEKLLFYAAHNSYIFGTYGTFIYKCNLDGSNLEKVIKMDSNAISGMTFNTYTRTLFYIHSVGNIYKTDYDGHNQLKIITNYTNPSSLTMFEDHLYFYTPIGYISRCPLYSNYQACNSFKIHQSFTDLFVIHQSSVQPQTPNICNNMCTDLCVPVKDVPKCICNDEYENECQQIKVEVSHNASSSGSLTTIIVITVIIMATAIAGSIYYYIQRKHSGSFTISMRFQNPLYGCPQPDNLHEKILNPGEHEYFNPIDNQEDQLKQNRLLSNKLNF